MYECLLCHYKYFDSLKFHLQNLSRQTLIKKISLYRESSKFSSTTTVITNKIRRLIAKKLEIKRWPLIG